MNPIYEDLKGKVVLISGGGTGIGRATAEAFAQQGCKIIIGDIRPEAEPTVKYLNTLNTEAYFLYTDVRDKGHIKALVKEAIDRFGKLDIAINNAGFLPPEVPLLDMADDHIDAVIDINLKSMLHAMKAQLDVFLPKGQGCIINMASVAGLRAVPTMAGYCASKFGVVGLTRAVASEYAAKGIRINAVCPGYIKTPMTKHWEKMPEFMNFVNSIMPMGRAGEPEEVAKFITFLASAQANYITGAALTIDGGMYSG